MDYHLTFLLMKIHSAVGSHIPDNKLSKCCLLPPKYFHEVVIWAVKEKEFSCSGTKGRGRGVGRPLIFKIPPSYYFLTMFVGEEIARKFSIESFTNDFRIIKERRAQKHRFVSKS